MCVCVCTCACTWVRHSTDTVHMPAMSAIVSNSTFLMLMLQNDTFNVKLCNYIMPNCMCWEILTKERSPFVPWSSYFLNVNICALTQFHTSSQPTNQDSVLCGSALYFSTSLCLSLPLSLGVSLYFSVSISHSVSLYLSPPIYVIFPMKLLFIYDIEKKRCSIL